MDDVVALVPESLLDDELVDGVVELDESLELDEEAASPELDEDRVDDFPLRASFR